MAMQVVPTLNEYFVRPDTYQRGRAVFHSKTGAKAANLELKVWDVVNNSASAAIILWWLL